MYDLTTKTNTVTKLVILAPKEYYRSYHNPESVKNLFQHDCSIGVEICFKYLKLSEIDFTNCVAAASLGRSFSEPKKKTKQYDSKAEIKIDETLEKFDSLKACLKESAWVEIKSPEDWPGSDLGKE